MSHLTLSPGASNPHGLFLHVKLEGVIRIPKNSSQGGNGSIVLLLTSAGRFVVSGMDVQAASNDLAQMNASELLSAVQIASIQQQPGGDAESVYQRTVIDRRKYKLWICADPFSMLSRKKNQ
jgi:hypothetical protein